MKMRVNRLRDTLKLLESVIPRKTTLPVLTNVLLKDGKAHATDLDKWVSIDLPEVSEDCLIPYQAVSDLLENVPGDAELTIEVKKKTLLLSWNGDKASYDTSPAEDYPGISDKKIKAEADIDGDALINTMAAMVPYCATEESRPVLTGVALHLGEKMALAGADGFRMAYQELPLAFPLDETIIIPASSVVILSHLWKKSPGAPGPSGSLVGLITGKRKLRLSLTDEEAIFRFSRVTLMAKLIQGTPPNFRQLIPVVTNKVRVFAPDFQRALGRVKNIASKGTGITRLEWADSVMTVSAHAEEIGAVETTLPAVTDDGPGKVALNVKYLSEYCSGKEDFFTMGVTDTSSPAVFTYRNSPTVVIMPMFVQW